MVLLGSVLNVWQIVLVGMACAGLGEAFDYVAWDVNSGVSRDLLYFAAFAGSGLFAREVHRNRAMTLQHLAEIERQSEARREAEEQLRFLIETSPAAVITADTAGTVIMANEAAHRMLGVERNQLPGKPIHRYLPSLRNVSSPATSGQFFRTVMQAHGQREDGEAFLADISFSTYRTGAGLRLAAMVQDTSEDLRTHEVSGLNQLLAGSRIAIGAVSHEIRNFCGAIAAVHQNLSRGGSLAGNRDFEALGNLIAGLDRIANLNLRKSTTEAGEVDLAALLDELRIVMAPALEEEDIAVEWRAEPGLPPVWADRSSLMQVFLNLITNSVRALSRKERRMLTVDAKADGDQVLVAFIDNGGGVAHPEYLFHPFQDGADSSGLGLYLSRAFLHSFGGEIRYVPLEGGASFVVNLNVAHSVVRSS
jgi:PAS domain S-box-containing protein